jgi:hypothetical protein
VPGNYYAIAVGNPCPSDSSNVLNVGLLDISQVDMTQWELYPNPASEEVVISTSSHKLFITLSNAMGQIVLSEETGGKARLSVKNFANGVYFVSIKDELGNKAVRRVQVLH